MTTPPTTGRAKAPGEEPSEEAEQEGGLSFLRAGRPEADLLSRLANALRVSRLHSLDNVAARETLGELEKGLTRFLSTHERAQALVGEGRRVYVNGRLVRGGRSAGPGAEDLADALERAGAGGLLLTGLWNASSAKALVAAFAPVPGAANEAARFEAIRKGLAAVPPPAHAQVYDRPTAAALAKEEEAGYASESQRAAFYFSRLLALADAAHAAAGLGRSPDVLGRHLRQTLMKIVDALEHPLFEQRLLACGVLDPEGVHALAAHAARVTVLAILMGRTLGLSRGNQGDLGFAALFHDLGRVGAERQQGAGDREDPSTLERHTQETVRIALRSRTYTAAGLLRLVVGLEHHRAADGVPAADVLGEPHVFSLIVGVADAFDRLEHGLPWRRPVGAAQALRTLAADPARYPPEVVALLADAIGRTPRGTILQLRSGDVAVVVAGGARQGNRPVIRRLTLSTGAPDPARTLAVLGAASEVAAELDPDVPVDWRAAVLA